ncbi:hypothetical protein SAMN04489717_2698 [Actinopolymorpha singaporensis]|uniref:Uncharacterized protein n=1 Tax=Actinopolymorpha singaporensis TaxID=117157 RepID=A0A1H1S7N8_9ACTN|nr:hypothetical protein SAMN04489717_2698 [Actinopolymorpha singaporensis]
MVSDNLITNDQQIGAIKRSAAITRDQRARLVRARFAMSGPRARQEDSLDAYARSFP